MEFGELLKQFLIDLQSLFRTQTKNLNITLPQIMLISSIPTDGIDMTSLSQRLGVDNSTLTRLIGILVKNQIVIKNNMEERNTDINTTIGFMLIGVILMFWIYTTPPPAQLESIDEDKQVEFLKDFNGLLVEERINIKILYDELNYLDIYRHLNPDITDKYSWWNQRRKITRQENKSIYE